MVNGIHIEALCTKRPEVMEEKAIKDIRIVTDAHEIELQSDNPYIQFPISEK